MANVKNLRINGTNYNFISSLNVSGNNGIDVVEQDSSSINVSMNGFSTAGEGQIPSKNSSGGIDWISMSEFFAWEYVTE